MNRPPQPNRSRNIIFIGMPCTGKTSFGRVYAAHTRRQFVDFDTYVERHASRTIPEIFAAEGEAGFRIREQKCLRRLEKKRGAVIAMGGGTLCNPANLRFAQSLGLIVFLNTPLDEIAKRAFRERQGRPLFANCASEAEVLATVERLWNLRHEFYECADVILETQYSSLDCLALQMLSVERRAHGMLQRRTLPPLLAAVTPEQAALPGGDDEPRPVSRGAEASVLSAEGERAAAPQPLSAEGERVAAPQPDGVPVDVSQTGSGELPGAAREAKAPEEPSRSPAETWDDVVWKRPQEAKPESGKGKDPRRAPRGPLDGLPTGEAPRRKKRRKSKGGEPGQPRESQPRDGQPPREPRDGQRPSMQGPRREGQAPREGGRDPQRERPRRQGEGGQPPGRDEGGRPPRREGRPGPREGGTPREGSPGGPRDNSARGPRPMSAQGNPGGGGRPERGPRPDRRPPRKGNPGGQGGGQPA